MSLQNIKDNIGSVAVGATGCFCATAFAAASYGVGYVLTNWLGASNDLSIVGGLITLVALGGITLLGGGMSALLGAATVEEKLGIQKMRALPALAGVAGGVIGGFKAAAIVGSLITFDRDNDVSTYVPTERPQNEISLTI
jgi:hypothetical protein